MVAEDDPWADRSDFLQEVLVRGFEKRRFQTETINAMPLYPTETILWDENQIPNVHYTGKRPLRRWRGAREACTYGGRLANSTTSAGWAGGIWPWNGRIQALLSAVRGMPFSAKSNVIRRELLSQEILKAGGLGMPLTSIWKYVQARPAWRCPS